MMSKKKKIPQEMQSTINFHVKAMTWVGGVGGLAGAGADIPLVATSWVTMTIALAEEAGHTLDSQTAKKLTMAMATAIGTFAFGMKAATMVFGWAGALFSGGATLAASVAANIALNRTLTKRYGQAAAIYFLETEHIGNAHAMAKIMYNIFRAKSGFTYAFNH